MNSERKTNLSLILSAIATFWMILQTFISSDTDWGRPIAVPLYSLLATVLLLILTVGLLTERSRQKGYTEGEKLSKAEAQPLWDKIEEGEKKEATPVEVLQAERKLGVAEKAVLRLAAKNGEISDIEVLVALADDHGGERVEAALRRLFDEDVLTIYGTDGGPVYAFAR